jgi:hypothetical protein
MLGLFTSRLAFAGPMLGDGQRGGGDLGLVGDVQQQRGDLSGRGGLVRGLQRGAVGGLRTPADSQPPTTRRATVARPMPTEALVTRTWGGRNCS